MFVAVLSLPCRILHLGARSIVVTGLHSRLMSLAVRLYDHENRQVMHNCESPALTPQALDLPRNIDYVDLDDCTGAAAALPGDGIVTVSRVRACTRMPVYSVAYSSCAA